MYFSTAEYEHRLDRIRQRMSERSIDLLLQFGQEAVCWSSGFYTPAFFAFVAVGVPLQGDPFLVLRFMEVPAANENCWFKDLRSYRDDQDPIAFTRDAVNGLGLSGARIGIDSNAWYLTPARYDQLRNALPNATFVDDGRLIDELRIVKSEQEVAYLREAARIVEAGLIGAIKATHEGATEREIAASMAYERVRAGSDLPIDGVLTTGERTIQGHGPWTDRKVRPGDQLFYEFHGIRNHYWARLARSGVLGVPTKDQIRIADVIISAQDAGLGLVRAGVTAKAIDAACRRPLIEAGLYKADLYTNRVGYGIGLNFRPSPGEFFREFVPSAEFVLEEGMVFHMIQDAEGIGFSDTIVVTKSGFDFITRHPRELFTC